MPEQVDPGTQRADQKIVRQRVVVVVVVDAHHTQSTVGVKRHHPTTRCGTLDQQPLKVLKPSRVVVERGGVEIQYGLGHILPKGNPQRWPEGVLCQSHIVRRPQIDWPRQPADPFIASGADCGVGVQIFRNGEGIGQGLHRERHGRQPAVVVPRVVQLQKHTVGHGIRPKVDVCGGQPELGGHRGIELTKAGDENLSHETCAQAARPQAVFHKSGELHGGGVGEHHIEQLRFRLQPKPDVGFRFCAPRKKGKQASRKKADCRVDAEVIPLHEVAKFSKNFVYSATASAFPSNIVS